jgi:Cof subfamily protein (haloacid dehalogenase superfamily)
MKKIISFDLDMTLLDHNNFIIPDSTLKAIDILRKNNYIVIASGRDMSQDMSKKYLDIVNPDAVVHLNGSKVEYNNKIIYEHFFSKTVLSELLTYVENNKFCIGTSIDNIHYYTNHEKAKDLNYFMSNDNSLCLKDARELLDKEFYTITMLGNKNEMDKIEKDFPNLKFPRFHLDIGCDILEKTISKAIGIKEFVKLKKLTMNDVIAFGDSLNDYEIIKASGIGIAMGNSHPKLKEVADYTTTDINDNGIWNACLYYNLF